jgi:hypothetical protein
MPPRFWLAAQIRSIAILFCVVATLGSGQRPPTGPVGPNSLENQVKAAFLLNFTKFIEWPADSAKPDTPFTICILADEPIGSALDQIVAGETVNGRPLVVQRIKREPVKSCQIVFVGKPEKGADELLNSFGPGVLTVGDGDAMLHDGAIIAFVIDNRRVRFDINLNAAKKADLKISSKLLSVAKMVEN